MLFAWSSAEAAEPPPPVRVSIVAPADVKIGTTVPVAVVLSVPAGWHIYWENPGQSGLATDPRLTEATPMDSSAPVGRVVTGPRFPTPERFEADGLVNYGYDGETGFVFDVHVPARSKLDLDAEVSWLLCKDVCVPGSGTARATLKIRGPAFDAPAKDPVAPYLAALPAPFAESGGTVSRAGGQLRVTLPGPGPFDVFPSLTLEAVWAPVVTTSADGGLLLTSPLPASDPGATHLVVTRGVGPARRGFTLDLSESP